MIARRFLLRAAYGICAVGAMELSALTTLPALTAEDSTPIDVNRGTINLEEPTPKASLERTPMGNPLWAIPLGSLSITRDRPLFTPSRRPSVPAIIATAPRVVAPKVVIRPPEPEHSNLTLIGTVVGENEGIGLFLDQTTHNFVRLKTGEGYTGWILRSVTTRETTLEKENQTETLSLPNLKENGTRAPTAR